MEFIIDIFKEVIAEVIFEFIEPGLNTGSSKKRTESVTGWYLIKTIFNATNNFLRFS